ncbi:hypothetical protein N7447_004203 [Penicillium robsamsonii]|uniref:uncharacterized protein n=1 Tax=Penicillium robsamsonii TaxID=1792511 RepID=UPI0025478447|nr:uncharacterized protein N7447_004203 [Penicillium robsamsonii]KAJ5827440.1 hypothetical protein N7447_004203 [Penicillium robsamsonii]
MVMKTITCEARVSAEDHVSKPDLSPFDLDKPGVDGNSYNPPHCAYPSWIQQLEQGVADYEKFIRWVKHDPSRVYYTIVSAQAEYEKLQQQIVKHANGGLEAHRARPVPAAPDAAELEHLAESIKSHNDDLKMKHHCVAGEAISYANGLGRLRLDEQTRAGPGVVASIETPH